MKMSVAAVFRLQNEDEVLDAVVQHLVVCIFFSYSWSNGLGSGQMTQPGLKLYFETGQPENDLPLIFLTRTRVNSGSFLGWV